MEWNGISNDYFKVLTSKNTSFVRKKTFKNIKDAALYLHDENFINIYNSDPFLFLVDLSLDVSEYNFHINLKNLVETKPLVLVFNFKNKIKIFSKDFKESEINVTITNESSLKTVIDIDALAKKTCEDFYHKLFSNLSIKTLNNDEFIEWPSDLLKEAVKSNNVIVLRFCSLFNQEIDESCLELATEIGSLNSISAILKLPFFDLHKNVALEYKLKKFLFNYEAKNGLSLLMLALNNIQDDEKIIEFFIQHCNINYAFDKKLAIDLAFESKKFDIVVKLLQAGSEFPSNMPQVEPDHEGMKNYINKAESFFNIIENGSLDAVKQFLTQESTTRYPFNAKNNSALFMALKQKHFKICALLDSRGFSPSRGENIEGFFSNLFVEEQQTMLNENVRFLRRLDNYYLFRLNSCSKVRHDNPDEDHEESRKNVFENLNMVLYMTEIMKILAELKDFEIIFDFKKKKLFPFDTQDSRHVSGITEISENGKIVIKFDARLLLKPKSYNLGLSYLAHEMAHAAVQVVYENQMNPFYKYESEIAGSKFKKNVVDHFFETRNHPILDDIFDYVEEKWSKEIIVLVPEVLTMEGVTSKEQDMFLQLKTKLDPLFSFYEEKTQKDFTRTLPLIAVRQETRNLNKAFNILDSLIDPKLLLSEQCLQKFEIDSQRKVVAIVTNCPQISMNAIYQLNFKTHKERIATRCIFGECVVNNFEGYYDAALRCTLPNELPSLVLDCSNYSKNRSMAMPQILKLIESTTKAFLILSERAILNELISYIGETEIEEVEINHSWDDFEEETKDKLLKKELKFQDKSHTYESLLGKNSSIMKYLDIKKLLDDSPFKVEEILKRKDGTIDTKYSQERFFSFQDEENPKKLIIVMNEFKNVQSVLIYGVAGIGKSTTLLEIAQRLKRMKTKTVRWTAFVELRQFSAYDVTKLRESSDGKKLEEFFSSDIFDLKDTFSIELFKHLFVEKRITLLFDGFDEVPVECSKFFMEKLEGLYNEGIKFIVASRTMQANETFLRIIDKVYLLKPFSQEDQTKFVRIALHQAFQEKEEDSIIFENMKLILSTDMLPLMQIPQNLKMYVEIYKEKVTEKDFKMEEKISSLFEFCEKFIEMMMVFWKGKGESVRTAKHKLHSIGTNALEFLQLLAVHHVFPNQSVEFEEILEIQNTCKEELSLLGLTIEDSKGNLDLNHETLIDFFLVDYVTSNLFKKSRCVESEVNFCFEIITHLSNEKSFESTRMMLDQAIRKYSTHNIYEKASFRKHQMLFQFFQFSLLAHNLCVEKCFETLDYISKLHVEDSVVFGNINDFQNNVLMSMVERHCQVFEIERVWNIIITKTNPERLKNFFLNKNCHGQALITLSVKSSLEVCNFIWKLALELFKEPDKLLKLLREKDLSNRETLHTAVEHSSLKVVSRVWRALNLNLTVDEKYQFFMEENELNVIRLAAKCNPSKDVFNYIWREGLESGYKIFELKELIQKKTNIDSIIQQCVIHNSEHVFETVISKLTVGGQQKVLKDVDDRGHNIYQLAKCRNKNKKVAEFVTGLMKKYKVKFIDNTLNFEYEELYQFFVESLSNYNQQSYEKRLQCSENLIRLCNLSHDFPESFCNKLKGTMELEKLRPILEIRNDLKNNCTFLHLVYAHEQVETVQNVHNLLSQEEFSEQIHKFLTQPDVLGIHPIGYAISHNTPEVLRTVLEFCRNILGEEGFGEFLLDEIKERKLLENSLEKKETTLIILEFAEHVNNLQSKIKSKMRQNSGRINITDDPESSLEDNFAIVFKQLGISEQKNLIHEIIKDAFFSSSNSGFELSAVKSKKKSRNRKLKK